MSYGTPPTWWHGRYKIVKAMEALQLLGFTDAAATLVEARDTYDAMQNFAGAIYSPGDVVTLQLNEYQINNLTQFLEAVKERPDERIGTWDTGDWYGEVLYKLRELGGKKDRGNKGPLVLPPPGGTA